MSAAKPIRGSTPIGSSRPPGHTTTRRKSAHVKMEHGSRVARARASRATLHRDLTALDVLGDLFALLEHAQQVPAPDLADLLLGVAAPHQLERDIERLGRAVLAVHAAAAIHVRADADVVDADQLHGVVYVIDEVRYVGARRRRILRGDRLLAPLVFGTTLGGHRLQD